MYVYSSKTIMYRYKVSAQECSIEYVCVCRMCTCACLCTCVHSRPWFGFQCRCFSQTHPLLKNMYILLQETSKIYNVLVYCVFCPDFPVGGRDIQVVPPGPASGGVPPMAHIGGVPMPKPFPAEDIDPQVLHIHVHAVYESCWYMYTCTCTCGRCVCAWRGVWCTMYLYMLFTTVCLHYVFQPSFVYVRVHTCICIFLQATRSLFVGNIPKNISVYELRDIFQRFGDVLVSDL